MVVVVVVCVCVDGVSCLCIYRRRPRMISFERKYFENGKVRQHRQVVLQWVPSTVVFQEMRKQASPPDSEHKQYDKTAATFQEKTLIRAALGKCSERHNFCNTNSMKWWFVDNKHTIVNADNNNLHL